MPDAPLFVLDFATVDGAFGEVGGMAIGPDGSVYVMDLDNHKLLQFDRTGEFVRDTGSRLWHWPTAYNFRAESPDHPVSLGIAASPDGAVYVVDTGRHVVMRLDRDLGHVGYFGRRGQSDAEGEFDTPVDVAVAPDGTVLVHDAGNRRVQRFTSEGSFLEAWGIDGACSNGPAQGMAAAPDGKLLMAFGGDQPCLQRFEPSGALASSWPIDPAVVDGRPREGGPWDVAAMPDGGVLVSVARSVVRHYDESGRLIRSWPWRGYGVAAGPDRVVLGRHGLVTSLAQDGSSEWSAETRMTPPMAQFGHPTSVAIAPGGGFYVVDARHHRVQRFDGAGLFAGQWGRMGDGPGEFDTPMGVAVSPNGNFVYVADTGNDRIQYFSAHGEHYHTFGSYGQAPGQLDCPSGVAVDDDGNVWIADTGNDRVQRLMFNGRFLDSWGTTGSGHGQVLAPRDLATRAGLGPVWVTDAGNHRIVGIGKGGYYHDYGTLGFFGGGDGQFQAPAGVGVAPDDTVLVADRRNNLVQRFEGRGAPQMAWGGRGTDHGEYESPEDVAVGAGGEVLVVDAGNLRVQRLAPDGELLGLWGCRSLNRCSDHTARYYPDGQFGSPADIAVAPDGSFYVADGSPSTRLLHYSSEGRFVGQWGFGAFGHVGAGRFRSIEAIDVSPDGTVYVLDDKAWRVQLFGPTGQHLGDWRIGAPGGFNRPDFTDIAAGPGGTVYVTNQREQASVQRYSATGELLAEWGGWPQLHGPRAISVGPSGDVYVAAGKGVERFSAWGDRIAVWGPLGRSDDAQGTDWHPVDVAVDGDGLVYVLDGRAADIRRFGRDGRLVDVWHPSTAPHPGRVSGGRIAALAVSGSAADVRVLVLYGDRVEVMGTRPADSWRGEYFGNRWLAERALKVSHHDTIDFDWNTGAPAPVLPRDGFSLRLSRLIDLPAGAHAFTLKGRGGARLIINGRVLHDNWDGPQFAATVTVPLGAGTHSVWVEYNDPGSIATLSLTWSVNPGWRPPPAYLPSTRRW